MAKLSYSEQLKHPKWQQRRLERLSISDFSCDNCGEEEKTLHVHHRRYVKGRMAWEYGNNELACLCENCHLREHQSKERLEDLLLGVDISMTDAVIGLIHGYVNAHEKNDPEKCWSVLELCGAFARFHEHDRYEAVEAVIGERVAAKRGGKASSFDDYLAMF